MMATQESYLVTAAVAGVAAVIDRFVVRRGAVKLDGLFHAPSTEQHMRFVLEYTMKGTPLWSRLDYELRDCNHPETVISGMHRHLDNASPRSPARAEYLLFDKHQIPDGEWSLHVRLQSIGSRINPLSKLFPFDDRSVMRFTVKGGEVL